MRRAHGFLAIVAITILASLDIDDIRVYAIAASVCLTIIFTYVIKEESHHV